MKILLPMSHLFNKMILSINKNQFVGTRGLSRLLSGPGPTDPMAIVGGRCSNLFKYYFFTKCDKKSGPAGT